MEITVKMSDLEFMEFQAYRTERKLFAAEEEKLHAKMEIMAKKVCWALEQDTKRPDRVKIVDQEHAAELLEMAKDFLA